MGMKFEFNETTLKLLLAIIELCFKYGPAAIAGIIAAYGKDQITVEDLEALRLPDEDEGEFLPAGTTIQQPTEEEDKNIPEP